MSDKIDLRGEKITREKLSLYNNRWVNPPRKIAPLSECALNSRAANL